MGKFISNQSSARLCGSRKSLNINTQSEFIIRDIFFDIMWNFAIYFDDNPQTRVERRASGIQYNTIKRRNKTYNTQQKKKYKIIFKFSIPVPDFNL